MAKRPDEPESRTAARNEGTVSVSPTTSATEGGAETEGESWSEEAPGTHTGGSAEGSSDPFSEGETDHPGGESMDSPEYRPRPDADKTAPMPPDSKHG
jgi:hypothetical protein